MMGATIASGAATQAGCSSDDSGSGSSARPQAPTNARDVKEGFFGVVRKGVLLGRDAGGLYAMTAICTHNQCDLTQYGEFGGAGIMCSCHGSMFSPTGERLRGPAVDSLKHFRVDVAPDGTISVDSSNVVDAAMRTPVPA